MSFYDKNCCVYRLTNILLYRISGIILYVSFLLGGFGVENQQNGVRGNIDHAACDFYGVGPKRKYIEQNQKHLTNWNHKFEKLYCLISVFPNFQNYVENAVAYIQT
jgi:hypothetical protein